MTILVRTMRLWIFIAVLAAVLVLFAWNAGKMLVVDTPQPSDVIVVLAGETYNRPIRGLELLNRGYAHRLLIDVPAAVTIYKFSQVQLAETYAHDLPEAAEVAICPIVGLSTHDESHDVEKCLQNETGSRVLIVTSDYHTRRALSIFRHEIRGKSFAVAAAYDDAEFGTRWWAHRQWAKTCLSEWMRLLWWSAIERWE